MLPNTEVQVATGWIFRAEVAGFVDRQARLARGCEIRRASNKPRYVFGDRIQRLIRGISSRHAFRVRGEPGQAAVPPVRQFSAQHPVASVCELRILAPVLFKLCPPRCVQRLSASADICLEMFTHLIWYEELLIFRPA